MTTYYVDPLAGDDANDGLSENAPLKTFPVIPPGDVGLIRRGTTMVLSDTITMRADVRIGAYGGGPRPTLTRGSAVGSIFNGFGVGGWTIENLRFGEVAQAIVQGGSAQSSLSGRTVRNCEFVGCGNTATMGSVLSLHTGGGPDYFIGNIVRGCYNTVIKAGADFGTYAHDGFVCHRNLFEDNLQTGNPSEGHIVDIAQTSSNVSIVGNLFRRNTFLDGSPENGGNLVSLDGVDTAEVLFNVFEANAVVGLDMVSQNSAGFDAITTNFLVAHNTVINNGTTKTIDPSLSYKFGVFGFTNTLAADVNKNAVYEYNIVVGNVFPAGYNRGVVSLKTGAGDGAISGVTLRKNVFWNNGAPLLDVVQNGGVITYADDGGILIDPMLDENYIPQNPALKAAATWLAGVTAYDGLPLPLHPDIGAVQDRSYPGRRQGSV